MKPFVWLADCSWQVYLCFFQLCVANIVMHLTTLQSCLKDKIQQEKCDQWLWLKILRTKPMRRKNIPDLSFIAIFLEIITLCSDVLPPVLLPCLERFLSVLFSKCATYHLRFTQGLFTVSKWCPFRLNFTLEKSKGDREPKSANKSDGKWWPCWC